MNRGAGTGGRAQGARATAPLPPLIFSKDQIALFVMERASFVQAIVVNTITYALLHKL